MKHQILGASQRREAPNRKRSAVMALRGRFGVFERRARAGWQVNDKRIRRLWREEGLRVPQRRRKKRLSGVGVAVGAMSPIRPNVIWAMDFQFDTTADGRTVKI
jgi:transposase InsO family protein